MFHHPTTSRSILAMVLLLVFSCFALARDPNTLDFNPEQSGGVFLSIDAEHSQAFLDLGLPIRLMIDYEAFLWLEMSETELQVLEDAGFPFTLYPDAGTVRVTHHAFDPTVDDPNLNLNANQTKADVSGFRLVEFHGPIKGEWLEEIRSLGYDVLQYYPHHTYLVWSPVSQNRDVNDLPYVRWIGSLVPEHKINQEVLTRDGSIENLDVVVYDDGKIKDTMQIAQALGLEVLQVFPSQPDRKFFDIVARGPASAVDALADLENVLWIGYLSPEPILDGEMSSQIVAGNYDAGNVPFTGYQTWLGTIGYDGSGVIWSITDTGVDCDHPDLNTQIVSGRCDFLAGCCDGGNETSIHSRATAAGVVHGVDVIADDIVLSSCSDDQVFGLCG